VEAILKEVYGGSTRDTSAQDYSMPENLKQFYAAMKKKDNI